MSAEDIVIDSANAAANTVATDEFVTLTKHALNLTGVELGRHVTSTDVPGLFSPTEVMQDGKGRLGAILALDDRAILAWTVGTFRMKNFETVIPYSAIESLELGTRPGGAMTKDRETLRIKADAQTWELVFANVFEGGRSIVPFLKGVLEGSIKPVFENE
ncbi:MAG TPA: hypothetical protein PKB03_01760 [Baekduia sp.]|nr:hypothetical protein [Baekduia sp.]